MPREKLTTRDGTTLEVSWGRDGGTVQVASIVPDGLARVVKALGEDGMTLVNSATGEAPLAGQSERTAPILSGWYASVDRREQVNDLIKVLRRARDQAFGADA